MLRKSNHVWLPSPPFFHISSDFHSNLVHFLTKRQKVNPFFLNLVFRSNPRVPCKSSVLPRLNLELWRESKGKPNVKNPQFAPGPPNSFPGGFNNVSTHNCALFFCALNIVISRYINSMVLTSFSHGQISHFSGAIVQRPAAVFQLIDKINTQGRRESVQSTGQTNQQQTKKGKCVKWNQSPAPSSPHHYHQSHRVYTSNQFRKDQHQIKNDVD